MGWRAITRDYEELREETHGRPVQSGEEGKLLAIMQEDYGRKVGVDLVNGIIVFDYDRLEINESKDGLILDNPRFEFKICEETSIVGEFMELEQKLEYLRDDNGRRILGPDGKFQRVRTDILHPLVWRPIWFSRITNGIPVKVIGAQVTLPATQGRRNVKKLVTIFTNGGIGID